MNLFYSFWRSFIIFLHCCWCFLFRFSLFLLSIWLSVQRFWYFDKKKVENKYFCVKCALNFTWNNFHFTFAQMKYTNAIWLLFFDFVFTVMLFVPFSTYVCISIYFYLFCFFISLGMLCFVLLLLLNFPNRKKQHLQN